MILFYFFIGFSRSRYVDSFGEQNDILKSKNPNYIECENTVLVDPSLCLPDNSSIEQKIPQNQIPVQSVSIQQPIQSIPVQQPIKSVPIQQPTPVQNQNINTIPTNINTTQPVVIQQQPIVPQPKVSSPQVTNQVQNSANPQIVYKQSQPAVYPQNYTNTNYNLQDNNSNMFSKQLSTVLNQNPLAKCQLIAFLEYSGVPPPWDQLLDIETAQHHQLPDPENIFNKIRRLMLSFDKIKNCIIESLITVEKFIGRSKSYLGEDLKDFRRYKFMLKGILKKLCRSPSPEVKNELFARAFEIQKKEKCLEKSYFTKRKWLLKIINLFYTI